MAIEEINFDCFYKLTQNVLNPTIFIAEPWINFLTKNVPGTPLAFKISFNGELVYTYGFITKKLGIKMFCSPFEGWNTPYIGFYSEKPIKDYSIIIRGLFKYLKKEYKIKYFEITDKNISLEELKNNKITYEVIKNMNYDLREDEETLFNKLPKQLRKKIRNYKHHDLDVVKAAPNNEFVKLYYDELIEVFALQKLKPFYSLEKVVSLFESFNQYQDNIVCYKSINTSTGEEIGTAIYFVYRDYALSFGSASFTSQKKTNMNHVIRWEAIKQFKSMGVTFFDFGGFNPYKSIFAPNIFLIPRVHISSIPLLFFFKQIAKHLVSLRRKIFKK